MEYVHINEFTKSTDEEELDQGIVMGFDDEEGYAMVRRIDG